MSDQTHLLERIDTELSGLRNENRNLQTRLGNLQAENTTLRVQLEAGLSVISYLEQRLKFRLKSLVEREPAIPSDSGMLEWGVPITYDYKGFTVSTSARQINHPPNEAWRPLFRVNGKDQSQAWTPRDRMVVFGTEASAIEEADVRARWLIDNSPATVNEPA